MYIRYTPNPPMALRAAPAGAKKPARAAPEALRNLGKPKIPVFLMVGVNCRKLTILMTFCTVRVLGGGERRYRYGTEPSESLEDTIGFLSG